MPIHPRTIYSPGTEQGKAAMLMDIQRRLRLLESERTVVGTLDGSAITNINGANIQSGTIGGVSIVNGTITAAQIQAGTITGSLIAANTITASHIAAGTITTTEIAANTITANDIAANTITAGNIAANTITAGQIAAATITGDRIAAATIDATKINVTTLSSISNNMGAITAGTITSATLQTSASGSRVVMDSAGLRGYALDGTTKVFEINSGSGVASFTGIAQLSATSVVPAGTLSGVILAANVPLLGGMNSFRNSSFENPVAPLDGWFVYSNGLSPVGTGDTIAATGKHGGRIGRVTNGTDTTGELGFMTDGTNLPPVEAGKTYTLSAYGMPSASGGNFLVYINWQTAAGVFVSASSGSTVAGVSNVWTRATLTATAPATAAKAQCYVWVVNPSSGMVYYFDALQFEEGAVPTGYAPQPDEILPNYITSAMVSANAITGTQIADNSVTTAKIAANTIQAGDIAALTITGAEIAGNTITGAKMVANTITASQIASGTITATQIAAGAITANVIAAGAITADKLSIGLATQDSLVMNGSFEDNTGDATLPAAWYGPAEGTENNGSTTPYGANIDGTAPDGAFNLAIAPNTSYSSKVIPVSPGDTYIWRFYARHDAGANTCYFRIQEKTGSPFADGTPRAFISAVNRNSLSDFNLAGMPYARGVQNTAGAPYGTPLTSTWTEFVFVYTVPAGIKWASLCFYNWSIAGYMRLDAVDFRKQMNGTFIENGTITTNQIMANTIQASNIAAGTITTTEIAANTITAGDIASATITGSQIAGSTITADKVNFSTGGQNLLLNGSFSQGGIASTSGYNLYNPQSDGNYFLNSVEYSTWFGAGWEANSPPSKYVMVMYRTNATANHIGIQHVLPNNSISGGLKYTQSAYIAGQTTGTRTVQFYIDWQNNAGTITGTTSNAFTIPADNVFRRYVWTHTAPAGSTRGTVYYWNNNSASSQWVYLGHAQLERGDVPTAWAQYIDPTVIDGSTVNSGSIIGGTVTGSVIRTGTTGERLNISSSGGIEILDIGVGVSNLNEIAWMRSAGTKAASISGTGDSTTGQLTMVAVASASTNSATLTLGTNSPAAGYQTSMQFTQNRPSAPDSGLDRIDFQVSGANPKVLMNSLQQSIFPQNWSGGVPLAVERRFNFGTDVAPFGGTATAEVIVNHGLGGTPNTVFVAVKEGGAIYYNCFPVGTRSWNSTEFIATFQLVNSGTSLGSVHFSWFAML